MWSMIFVGVQIPRSARLFFTVTCQHQVQREKLAFLKEKLTCSQFLFLYWFQFLKVNPNLSTLSLLSRIKSINSATIIYIMVLEKN